MVDLIVGARQSGRTTELVAQWLEDNKGTLAVFSYDERARIIRQFALPPYLAERVFVVPSANRFREREGNLYVDNAEVILRQLSGIRVKAMSVETNRLELLP